MLPLLLGNLGSLYFYKQNDGQAFAMQTGNPNPLPVDTSKYSFPDHSNAAKRVAKVLKNCLADAVFVSDESQVIFRPLSVGKLESGGKISCEGKTPKHFVTENGKVCYTSQNKFYIWDPDKKDPEPFHTLDEKITAVIRTHSGDFFFGDKQGNIHTTEGAVFAANGKVKKLVLGEENQVFAHIGESVYVLDSSNGELLGEVDVPEDVEILNGGYICYIQDESLIITTFKNGVTSTKIYGSVCKLHVLANNYLLLIRGSLKGLYCQDEVKVSLQDLKSNHSWETKLTYPQYKNASQAFSHAYASPQSFATPAGHNKKCYSFYFKQQDSEEENKHVGLDGCGVVASCQLVDGSIALCTRTSDPYFVVVSQDGEVLYSCGEILNKRNATFINELPNGNLVIAYEGNEIEIIHPVTHRELGIKKIEENDFYRARRFYEKAVRSKPWDNETKRIYTELLCRKLDTEKFADPEKKRIRKLLRQIGLVQSKKKGCRYRLLLGEGGFLYTEALVKKHPDIADHIIATELTKLEETNHQLKEEKLGEIQDRVAYLKKK